MNRPESLATLRIQQQRLIDGLRAVQMFPVGTDELPLPSRMRRFENERGTFHYNPTIIRADLIAALSAIGRENEFLELGPYSKPAIAMRNNAGERLIAVTEYTADGVEVRSAGGTDQTMAEQVEYFERTKERGSKIVVGFPERVAMTNRSAA